MSYFLISKTHEDLLQLCFSLFSFPTASLNDINEDKVMSHLKFNNLSRMPEYNEAGT